MISYQVDDLNWFEYTVFETEQEARDYIKCQLDNDPASDIEDFRIYKRERIA